MVADCVVFLFVYYKYMVHLWSTKQEATSGVKNEKHLVFNYKNMVLFTKL